MAEETRVCGAFSAVFAKLLWPRVCDCFVWLESVFIVSFLHSLFIVVKIREFVSVCLILAHHLHMFSKKVFRPLLADSPPEEVVCTNVDNVRMVTLLSEL